MLLKKRGFHILVWSLFTLCPAWSFADTHPAASCNLGDVVAVVGAASTNDTVFVPAGSCTWNSQLQISKGITLQGAGVGLTIITAATGSTAIVSYAPANASLNEKFRMTGFEFHLGDTTPPFKLTNETVPFTPITKIRLDHNSWKDCGGVTEIYGSVYGVIDHNEIHGHYHADHYGRAAAGGQTSWNTETFTFGTNLLLYYENNTFNIKRTISTCGHGGRVAFRYNTINFLTPNSTSDFYPIFDAHGNQSSGVYACMGTEVYGNVYNNNGYNFFGMDQRGGMEVYFYNTFAGTPSLNVREEYCDTLSPTNYGTKSSDGETQHVSKSYYWNNRNSSGNLVNAGVTQNSCPSEYSIAENVDIWNDARKVGTFDGTYGIGCGPLSARPATCTTGVAYWATNQSCSGVPSESVGEGLTNPLSGTLFRCVATNTWQAFFVPYTYPHPLTADTPGTRHPEEPSNLSIH